MYDAFTQQQSETNDVKCHPRQRDGLRLCVRWRVGRVRAALQTQEIRLPEQLHVIGHGAGDHHQDLHARREQAGCICVMLLLASII